MERVTFKIAILAMVQFSIALFLVKFQGNLKIFRHPGNVTSF